MLRTKILAGVVVLGAVGVVYTYLGTCHTFKNPNSTSTKTNTPIELAQTSKANAMAWIDQETQKISQEASNLNPKVLKLSLVAYLNARKKGMDDKKVLTIVDYSKPSADRRLWVIDLNSDKVLFNTWVAHGKNSGEADATSFSNKESSLKSSLGVYETVEPYTGHDGYSLRVRGLDPGFNDNAYDRAVVFHGAAYVSAEVAKDRGMLGRSWGCMAVPKDTIAPLINTIKDDTIVVAYYPDQKWLNSSSYLDAQSI